MMINQLPIDIYNLRHDIEKILKYVILENIDDIMKYDPSRFKEDQNR